MPQIGNIQSWTLPKNIEYAFYAIHAIYIYTKRWGGNTILKRDLFYITILVLISLNLSKITFIVLSKIYLLINSIIVHINNIHTHVTN